MKLFNVVEGTKKLLEDVSDEAFAKKMMGDGIAIIPSQGKVLAPVSGVVTMLFPTGHAIGIQSNDGVEVLIHIGIDTVEMNGNGFLSYVEVGQHVEIGTPLIEFDIHKILDLGYETDVMVIITNSSQYTSIVKTKQHVLKTHDVLLEIV